MKTTTLFAELVVVGVGASLFVLLVFFLINPSFWYLLQDKEIQNTIERLTKSFVSIFALIPVLSVIYMLGIVVNNLSYRLFRPLDECMQETKLETCGGKKKYGVITNKLYSSASTEMIDDFEFRRSKIRICRGWFVTSLLIVLTLVIYFVVRIIIPLISQYHRTGFWPLVGFIWFIIIFLITKSFAVQWYVLIAQKGCGVQKKNKRLAILFTIEVISLVVLLFFPLQDQNTLQLLFGALLFILLMIGLAVSWYYATDVELRKLKTFNCESAVHRGGRVW